MVIFYLIFSITKEKPKWKMFAALLLTFLLPSWQPTVWLCWAHEKKKKKKCIGQSLTDDWSQYSVRPKWGGAGPETIDKLVSQDSDLKEEWGNLVMNITVPQFKLIGLRQSFHGCTGHLPSPNLYKWRSIWVDFVCLIASTLFHVPWRNLYFLPLFMLFFLHFPMYKSLGYFPNPSYISFHSTYTDG